jgi:hypothetical protein
MFHVEAVTAFRFTVEGKKCGLTFLPCQITLKVGAVYFKTSGCTMGPNPKV